MTLDNAESARHWFCLAQSYRDAGRLIEAADAYAKRAKMRGCDEEAWMACLQQARCLRGLGDESGFVSKALSAFDRRPHRAEPLYDLAKFYREKGLNHLAELFAEFGLTVQYPKTDILFIDDYVYTTGLLEEYSIAASGSRDAARKDRGFAACNYLTLSRGTAEGPRQLAWSNLCFYIQAASVLLPSFNAQQIDFSPPDGYLPLNPSVARVGDQLFVAQRVTNNVMIEDGLRYRYLAPEGQPFMTRNFLLRLNTDLSVRSTGEILPPKDMPAPAFPRVLGFEDIRLFSWRGALWGSASAKELSPEGWCEQILVRLEPEGECTYRMVDWRKLEADGRKAREKNWMPQVQGDNLSFIYLCDPTRVVASDGHTIQEHVPDISADRFRGGSQLVPFNGGWLALIHEQICHAEQTRFYFHRFVWFNRSNHLAGVSRPFYFNRKGVEFAVGLAWHPDQNRLLISFGVADSESWIATVRAGDIRATLERTSEIRDGRAGQPMLPSTNEWSRTGHIVESNVNCVPVRFFVTNASDEIMKFHQQGQFYETEELQLITSHYRGTGVFVDIGANVGNHAIYISKFTNAPRIIVFEPNDEAASILRINCSLNDCKNVDTGFLGKALGSKAGKFCKETPDPQNLGHTYFFADALGETDAIAGDSVLLDERVEFIKLDVEGMELEVLEGLRETITRWRPMIFVEIWDSASDAFTTWCTQARYDSIGSYQRYPGIRNYLISPLPIDVSRPTRPPN